MTASAVPDPAASPRGNAVPRRTRGAKTRDALIETAISLIAKNGIAGTSVLSITQELGLSNSNFYYYFDNIDRLLETVGHAMLANLVEAIRKIERDDPAARIACGPLMILDYIEDNADLLPILLHVIDDPEGAHSDLAGQLREDLIWGRDCGRFPLADIEIALELCRAVIARAVRMRLAGATGALACEAALFTLRGLGVPAAEAADIVERESRLRQATAGERARKRRTARDGGSAA